MGVIGAQDIDQAERMLSIMYGATPDSVPRQLSNFQVDSAAFDQFLAHRLDTLKKRYNRAWRAMDPTIEPAINTLLLHFFLCGLVIGRLDGKEMAA